MYSEPLTLVAFEYNHSTPTLHETQVEYLYGFNGFAADYVNAEINI